MILTALIILATGMQQPAAAPPLPLVVVPPSAHAAPSGTLAVLLTGDGGWSHVDKAIAQKLSDNGDAVVAINSLHYFAHKRSSAGVAADISELARAQCRQWNCQRIVLIGYSMGADVLPFVIAQLAEDVRPKVAQLDLVSLGHEAVFKFFPTQWIGLEVGHKFATLPQLATIDSLDIVCIYGTSDPDPACRDLPVRRAHVIALRSGHVMGKVAAELADTLAAHVRAAHTRT
ncbi:MAG TPA: AcvB/VirJ family lysyl-phosphatidylglycerol hydrolase [Longimicrobiales bacterium]